MEARRPIESPTHLKRMVNRFIKSSDDYLYFQLAFEYESLFEDIKSFLPNFQFTLEGTSYELMPTCYETVEGFHCEPVEYHVSKLNFFLRRDSTQPLVV